MKKYMGKAYILRYLFVSMALFINGLNITLAKISCLGTDPFSSLNYSLSSFFPISMGKAMMIINGILLVFCFLFMRRAIGYGMIACTLILGNASDFWNGILVNIIGHEITFTGLEHMPLRLGILATGIIMNIFFCSFYIGGEVGMAPYDALGYMIEKLSHNRIPFKFARIITDIICVAVAYLLSKPAGIQWQIIGIGTMVMAFGTGPVLDFFLTYVSKPFYNKICGPKE